MCVSALRFFDLKIARAINDGEFVTRFNHVAEGEEVEVM